VNRSGPRNYNPDDATEAERRLGCRIQPANIAAHCNLLRNPRKPLKP
jgi:hypothetical protein